MIIGNDGTIAIAVWFSFLWLAEGLIPFYQQFRGNLRKRIRHDATNLGFGLINTAITAVGLSAALVMLDSWLGGRGFGLMHWLDLPAWAALPVSLLLFDLWMYLWHRLNHRVPLLWRFHRMHHSDVTLDATSGVRFHPGEIVLSALARMIVIPLLGVPLWHLAIYETVFAPVVLFHHSNVRLPRWLDHGLLGIIVTPAMHRVHHSRWQPETDSNYGSVLPYWDLLFRTFRLREDARTIDIGLDGLDTDEWQSVRGMLRTPVVPTHDRKDR